MCRQHRSRRFAATATLLVAGLMVWGPDMRPRSRLSWSVSRPMAVLRTGAVDVATVTPDGRVVAFSSQASNLVTGDTNDRSDVFVRDLTTGITTRVSITSAGEQGSDDSFGSSISDDGRVVAFRRGPPLWTRTLTRGRTSMSTIAPPGRRASSGWRARERHRVSTERKRPVRRVHVDGHDARAR